MFGRVLVLSTLTCVVGCSSGDDAPATGRDTGTNADVGAADVDAGERDLAFPEARRTCDGNDLPAIVRATADPARFAVADLGSATFDVQVWVECFTGPIEHVTLGLGDPHVDFEVQDPTQDDGHLVLEGLQTGWLTTVPAGTYPLHITASSATETLTEAGLAAIEIEE